ncbi:MAG TPA: hypothetical protein VE999_05965 [Gemmataceae bacterium]|nr:hypothetical protein [Gemmataceae bacterium]
MDANEASKERVNARHRLIYIRQRLIELRAERERLIEERDRLKTEAGNSEARDDSKKF